jgi:hypothetical protein
VYPPSESTVSIIFVPILDFVAATIAQNFSADNRTRVEISMSSFFLARSISRASSSR